MDSRTHCRGGVPVALLVVLAVAALGLVGWYYYNRSGPPAPPPRVLTPEARTYVRGNFLQLQNVEMSAKESFSGGMLVEITGQISNTGAKIVKLVEVNCVFHDVSGQVVMREPVPIVSEKMKGLQPGEVKNFRLPFDSIPDTWNQATPQLVIAQILFEP